MLTLPIKRKWYQMILSGEKAEEYREIKPYWTTRIENAFKVAIINNERIVPWEILHRDGTPPEQKIRFRCGYQKQAHSAVAKVNLKIGPGRPEWCVCATRLGRIRTGCSGGTMSDYISREAAIDAMRKVHNPNTARAVMSVVTIRELPAADVVEVRHGRWIFGETMHHGWMKCSECLVSQTPTGVFSYCPNCGAKMDGGDHDGGD